MTLHLELTPDQEKRLFEDAKRNGVDAQTWAIMRLFDSSDTGGLRNSLADRLRAAGALGAIAGKPRMDGRNRSEIEAAADVTH